MQPDQSRKASRPGVSRRGFLKGLGSGLLASGFWGFVGGRRSLGAGESKEQHPLGPGKVPVTLTVNGRSSTIQVEPRTTLIDCLRTNLRLTGTKPVCGRGECGACTVLIDGKAAYSCMMLAVDAQNRSIITIEGLASGDGLHPVQEAFMEHDGLQCGFCTPGQILTTAAFLAGNPKPSDDELRVALSGNLCRCGAYPHIFEAAQTAAKRMQGRER